MGLGLSPAASAGTAPLASSGSAVELASPPSAGWPAPGVAMPRPWGLIDLSSQQVLAGSRIHEPVGGEAAIALLSVALTHEALQKGRLQRSMVLPSPAASLIPAGPRLFLGNSGETVQTLLQGVLLIQARDAMVALGTAISGDVPKFVDALNQLALRLGLANTRLIGLQPDEIGQSQTTVADLAVLAIWLQTQAPTVFADARVGQLVVQGIQHDNRNRLALLDDAVDGLLGSGDRAGAHLLVSMVRQQPLGVGSVLSRRLLVVMPDIEGFDAASRIALRLLAFGFRNFDVVELAAAGPFANPIPVYRGHRSLVGPTLAQRLLVSVPRGQIGQLAMQQTLPKGLLAPIAIGQPVGSIEIKLNGQNLRQVPLVASEPIAEAGLLGRAIDSLRLLFVSAPQTTNHPRPKP